MSNRDPYDTLTENKTGLRKQVPAQEKPAPQQAQKPNTPNVVVSKDTLQGLEALSSAMKAQQEDLQRSKEIVEEKVVAPASVEEETVKVDLGETPEGVSSNYETVFYRNTPIDNPRVRSLVEKRCSELSFSDLILEGFVSQEVEVMPGKLIASYRSLKASDNLWLERQATVSEETYEKVEWIGYGRLVLSLQSINGEELPTVLDDNGSLNTRAFELKKHKIMSYPEKVVEILLVNLAWFEDRVGQLFVNDYEKLKNG